MGLLKFSLQSTSARHINFQETGGGSIIYEKDKTCQTWQ